MHTQVVSNPLDNFHKTQLNNWLVAWKFLGICLSCILTLAHLPTCFSWCTNEMKWFFRDGYQRWRIPWLFFQATERLYRHQFLCFQRMAHHVFPYLVGILISCAWSFVLGTIEVFDSDMKLAGGYYAFAGWYQLTHSDSSLTVDHCSIAVLLVDLLCVALPRSPRDRNQSQ